MTNREKYRERIRDIVISGDTMGFVKGAPVGCHSIDCRTCDIYEICAEDAEAEMKYREEWAKAPTATEDTAEEA